MCEGYFNIAKSTLHIFVKVIKIKFVFKIIKPIMKISKLIIIPELSIIISCIFKLSCSLSIAKDARKLRSHCVPF